MCDSHRLIVFVRHGRALSTNKYMFVKLIHYVCVLSPDRLHKAFLSNRFVVNLVFRATQMR
jgi:hypothetical protein